MKDHPYKVLDVKYEDFEFTRQTFVSTRYSMTSIVDCENLYSISKDNDFSFFNLCVAAIYKTIESIGELKQCFVDGEGREYEHINIVLPLIKEDHSVKNICIESIHNFESFKEWNDFLENAKDNEEYEYRYGPESKYHIFAILSCLPWVHYSSFIDTPLDNDAFTPSIHWGKYEDGKIPVTLNINHIFVFGYHLGLFFNRLGEYMENPNLIFEKIE